MLFCFGLGYVAQYLTSNFNIKHIGTHTNGKNNLIFNEETELDITKFLEISHVLISIPPINGVDIVHHKMLEQLKALPNLKWVGYLSATSVYQNADGAEVDENYPLEKFEKKSLDRQKAENLWLTSTLPIHIFRLAAIYGKGRSVLDLLLNGTARRIYKKNHFFSRIHVADIANILFSSMNNIKIGSIYNVADDLPSSNMEIVEYGAKLLNIDPPKIEDYEKAELSEMMRYYYSSSKKIVNNKIKNELNVKLQYPSYKEGLAEILQNC